MYLLIFSGIQRSALFNRTQNFAAYIQQLHIKEIFHNEQII